MFFHKKILSFIGILALFMSFAGCGSSSGGSSGGGGDTPTATEEAEITSLVLTIAGLSSALFEELETGTTIICSGGGTVTISADGNTITVTNCIEEGLTINGTFSVTEVGAITTAGWDFTVTGGGDSFTISGAMTFDDDDGSLSSVLTSVFNGTSYSIIVDLTINADENFSGTVSFSSGGTSLATCTFNNFDTDTAEVADYLAACGL